MKRVLAGTVSALALLAISSAAMADGYARRGVGYVDQFTWSGLYIGLHAGRESKEMKGSDFTGMFSEVGFFIADDNSGGALTQQKLHGYIYGGQVGYNHQFGKAVIGSELSATWGGVDDNSDCFRANTFGSVANPLGPPGNTNTFSRTCGADQKWSVQWLNKLGVAHGPVLGYVTGGIAVTEVSIARSYLFTVPLGATRGNMSASWGGDANYVGAVFGGGVQFALGGWCGGCSGLSLGLEYLHTTYASADTLTVGSFSNTRLQNRNGTFGMAANAINDLDAETWRVVLNYKFNDCCGGPLK